MLQCSKDIHAWRQLTYKREPRALLSESFNGENLVDDLQSLMQASRKMWEDEDDFADRILDANRGLGSIQQEAEPSTILIKGVGRKVPALGRNFNIQGWSFPKLRKHLSKSDAATREAHGIKLQAKLKGSASRSSGREER